MWRGGMDSFSFRSPQYRTRCPDHISDLPTT
jgi:hypothetical protein